MDMHMAILRKGDEAEELGYCSLDPVVLKQACDLWLDETTASEVAAEFRIGTISDIEKHIDKELIQFLRSFYLGTVVLYVVAYYREDGSINYLESFVNPDFEPEDISASVLPTAILPDLGVVPYEERH